VLADHVHQRDETLCAASDASPGYNCALLINQSDVVVRLGPINPAGNSQHRPRFLLDTDCGELKAGAAT
jgi:hypothetical protein